MLFARQWHLANAAHQDAFELGEQVYCSPYRELSFWHGYGSCYRSCYSWGYGSSGFSLKKHLRVCVGEYGVLPERQIRDGLLVGGVDVQGHLRLL